MRYLDFSSWQAVLTTFVGLAIFTLVGVGIRMLMMQTVQQRRERMNRQINERLRTLIAAYRTLGGSFTGELTVDPTHLRDLRATPPPATEAGRQLEARANSDRARRIRDAVEAALADILLLGTEEHCRLAGQAASDMAAGRPIHTADLVIALRNFIREALDLGPMPADVRIPLQGPTRTQGARADGRRWRRWRRQGRRWRDGWRRRWWWAVAVGVAVAAASAALIATTEHEAGDPAGLDGGAGRPRFIMPAPSACASMTIDWFSPAQCVGYVAFVLGVGSFLQSDDRRFKQFMAAECLAYIVHFTLLGNPTAVASSTMSLLRSLLALRTRSVWVAAAVVAANLALGLALAHAS